YEDDIALFYQDVPPELASEALRRSRRQSEARLGEPSPLAAWPAVPTRVLLCRDDRLFPAAFVRRVARERLRITPDEIDGGPTPGSRSRPSRPPLMTSGSARWSRRSPGADRSRSPGRPRRSTG